MIIHAQNIISRHHEWWHMNVFDMQHLSNEDKKKSHTLWQHYLPWYIFWVLILNPDIMFSILCSNIVYNF